MEKKITLGRGVEVEFLNVAPLLDVLNQQRAKRIPKPPVYSVQTATGATETHAHYQRFVKEKELDDAGNPTDKEIDREDTSLSTDEERAAWAKYLADTQAAQSAFAEKFTKTAMLYGLKYDKTQYESDAWVHKQEFVGLTVPAEPLEREWHWIQTELIANEDEAKLLITGVLAASGTDEEVISAMESLFRGAVGGTERDTPNGLDHPNGRESVVSVKPLRANRHGGKIRHPRN